MKPLDIVKWGKNNPWVKEKSEVNNYNKDLYFLVNTNDLDKFLNERNPIFLTDDFVPVDNLLAPIIKYAY